MLLKLATKLIQMQMAKKNHNVQQFKNALKIEIKQWKILWAYAKKYYKILQICKFA